MNTKVDCSTNNQSWKTATSDAECTTVANDKCKSADVSAALTAMGATVAKAWTSATNATCVDLVSTQCRCADNSPATGTRTNASTNMACVTDDKDCKGITEDATLATGYCAEDMGTTKAWTAAATTTCVTMATTECRNTDKTKKTGDRKSNTDSTCKPATTTASSTASSTGSAGEGAGEAGAGGEGGEGGEGAGAGGAGAGEGESSGAFVALLLMSLSML